MAKLKEEGIFCLETASWDNVGKGRTSLEYFLRFLEVSSGGKIPHRHYDVATKEEFLFYLDKWNRGEDRGKKIRDKYPVLWLAFHGGKEVNSLAIPKGGELAMHELVDCLKNEKDNDAIIHFSACCSSVNPDKMKNLLKETGTLSVSGYNEEVGWYQSAAFELLLLAEFFDIVEDVRQDGLPEQSSAMQKFAIEKYKENKAMVALGEELGFRMWYDARGKIIPKKEEHPNGIVACKKEDY